MWIIGSPVLSDRLKSKAPENDGLDLSMSGITRCFLILGGGSLDSPARGFAGGVVSPPGSGLLSFTVP